MALDFAIHHGVRSPVLENKTNGLRRRGDPYGVSRVD